MLSSVALVVYLWFLQLTLPTAYAKCCGVVHPNDQTCGDRTIAHWCCGYGTCNLFCCHCKGGKKTSFAASIVAVVDS